MWTWAELDARDHHQDPANTMQRHGTRFDPFHMRRNLVSSWCGIPCDSRSAATGPIWATVDWPRCRADPAGPFYDLPYFHQGQYLWGTPNPILRVLIPRDIDSTSVRAFSEPAKGSLSVAKFWGYRNVVNMPTSGHNTRHWMDLI